MSPTAQAASVGINGAEESSHGLTDGLVGKLTGSEIREMLRSRTQHSREQGTGYAATQVEKEVRYNELQQLEGVCVTELLQQDGRPTFVVDLGDRSNLITSRLHLTFSNPALNEIPWLFDLIRGEANGLQSMLPISETYRDFKSWILDDHYNFNSLGSHPSTFSFAGLIWIGYTVRKQHRIISGHAVTVTPPEGASRGRPSLKRSNAMDLPTPPWSQISQSPPCTPDYFHNNALEETKSEQVATLSPIEKAFSEENSTSPHQEILLSVEPGLYPTDKNPSAFDLQKEPLYPGIEHAILERPDAEVSTPGAVASLVPKQPLFDWTRLPVTSTLSEHIQFARSVDWAATSLGPIENWPCDLRAMSNLIMAR